MAAMSLKPTEALLVTSRGTEPTNGLYRWTQRGGSWTGVQLATVSHMQALAGHPSLPVVYGTAGVGQDGTLHGWRLAGDSATSLGEKPSGGAEPCHLAVDPSGRLLVITNYTASALGVQHLAPDGSFDGPIELVPLVGSGPETDRQEAAHPHQALFHDGKLFVVDLGADLLREFAVDPGKNGASALTPLRTTAVPAGSGPRHAAILPDGRFALSGELGANLLVGRPGEAVSAWANIPASTRTGPAKTRHTRNYPGDIQRALAGRHVYVANRGYETISTFDVSGQTPVLVSELDAAVDWPQHMLVTSSHLLIAGWDSSRVVAMPLNDGQPGPAESVFECAGAGWLLLQPRT